MAGRRTTVNRARFVLGTLGVCLLAFGAFRLLTGLARTDLLWLLVWLVVAVAVHDVVVAPVTVVLGVGLRRVPPRARRYAHAGLLVAALVTVVAAPLVLRQGTQPASKAILERGYGTNLLVLLGLVAAVSVLAYVVRVARDRGAPEDLSADE